MADLTDDLDLAVDEDILHRESSDAELEAAAGLDAARSSLINSIMCDPFNC
jgi:hypothetical protein